MKVLTVFGTRPEAIKMAPVVRALDDLPDRVETTVCVTAQHRDMLDQILELFDIHPHHDLRVMEENQSPTQVAAAVLSRLEGVLAAERPDWVLVQGDTTTAATAALAAFYARARVGHVEAGLRTRDRWQPFPEEINRRIVGVLADRHFAPTARARENLLGEHTPPADVLVTGNTVIDALRWVATHGPRVAHAPEVARRLARGGSAKLVLLTAHRRENFGAPLEAICRAVRTVAERARGGVEFVYPVHPNPNVREPVQRILAGMPNVTLTEPLGYAPLVDLLQRAHLVLTDSGGLQEEAPAFGVPVLVLRQVTERPEAIEAGTARLVGTDERHIVGEVERLLDDAGEHARMARAVNPFGDGHASARIVASLLGEPTAEFVPGATPPAGGRRGGGPMTVGPAVA